jgi:hypothetical protein
VKQITSWLGVCPNWKKTGGKVKSRRARLAVGGLKPDAEPELA